MEFVGYLLGFVVVNAASGVAWAIGARVVRAVRWRCGWRPDILDPELVERTAEELAAAAAENDARQAEEEHGYEMSEEEKERHRARVETALKAAIEHYVGAFVLGK